MKQYRDSNTVNTKFKIQQKLEHSFNVNKVISRKVKITFRPRQKLTRT